MSGRKIMMASEAYHSHVHYTNPLEAEDLCIVTQENDTDYFGCFVFGMGVIGVRFPKATTRELTQQERAYWRGKKVSSSGGQLDVDVDYERPLERI